MTNICIRCGKGTGKNREIEHSLRLTRDKKTRKWQVNPVCTVCRRNLIMEAKAAGRFIPFFDLKASDQEAAKRNGENRAFLEQFSLPQNEKKLRRLPKKKSGKVVPLRATVAGPVRG